jgi:hypothetical protein
MRYLEWDGSSSRSRSYSASDMPSESGSVCVAVVTTTVIEAGRKLYEISGIDSSARRARCCRKYLARVALYSPHGECLLCLKTDIGVCPHDVRFTPESGHQTDPPYVLASSSGSLAYSP